MKKDGIGQKNAGAHIHQNGGFKSSLGFVLACVGSAVGMGNIWMFPYRVGQYGGGAFLVPYLLFIVLFGLVGLSAEFAVGRRVRTGTLGAYEYCWSKIKKGRAGYVLGWIPLLGSLGIAIGYAIIVGCVVRSLAGSLACRLARRRDFDCGCRGVFFPGDQAVWQCVLACVCGARSGGNFDVWGHEWN